MIYYKLKGKACTLTSEIDFVYEGIIESISNAMVDLDEYGRGFYSIQQGESIIYQHRDREIVSNVLQHFFVIVRDINKRMEIPEVGEIAYFPDSYLPMARVEF